ncbi:hypothetical protein Nepgr_006610 [Nepenthes gracilis]|uniref:Uncharacterized protein n=1 Tax=Nepenthes gracilis TaxID=150966 RepID=A0AAD3XHL4_NEPGR|nr:hypothetical protein Nepgr_006610 [Nepenthes gracilis]
MAPEIPAPAPSPPPSPNQNFPPLSVSILRNLGRRSLSRFLTARVSPGIPVSQNASPPSSSLVELSIPPHQSPPPSSSSTISSLSTPSIPSSLVHSTLDFASLAPILSCPCSPCGDASDSVPCERPSGRCPPPFLDVSHVMAEVLCFAISVQVDGVSQSNAADSELPGGALICAFPDNRSAPDQVGSPVAKIAINRLQMGSPDSQDSDVPTGNPPGSFGSQEVHQLLQEGLPPTEKSVDVALLAPN